jgi:hypothetical protein
LPRQLRFRFPPISTTCGFGGGFAIARQPDGFAVVPLGDDGRILRQPGLGIAYAHTLESAHRTLPDGLLCIDGMEAARYGKRLPAALADVLEVWF